MSSRCSFVALAFSALFGLAGCAQQPATPSGTLTPTSTMVRAAVSIHHLSSARRNDHGKIFLMIRGEVVNDSHNVPATVPPLAVQLLDDSNNVIQKLDRVTLNATTLTPGQRLPFRIDLSDVAGNVTHVRVAPRR